MVICRYKYRQFLLHRAQNYTKKLKKTQRKQNFHSSLFTFHFFFVPLHPLSRAPRDGRFTEKIGSYNPNTNPATVDLNFDRALYWVEVGAQPTDTVRNILSREGVYLMKHLKGGVKKGAFDEATAQKKFDAWKADKQKGLEKVAAEVAKAKKDAAAKALAEEKKVNEAIAKKVADKKAAAVAEPEVEAPAEEAAATEEAPAEA